MKIKTRYTWKNSIKKYTAQPLKFFKATTLNDLRQIIIEAEQNHVRVRAVGSGHSFSEVAISNGYLVDISRLRKIDDNIPSFIKDPSQKTLVQVQAGITVQRFNKMMVRRHLCVVNMGGIDEQTLAGAISTGTHGTGKDLPAFHGMVMSIVLVTSGGKVFRIEPNDGITNKAIYAEEGVDDLIQDDQKFNSVLVGLGCFGIVYSLILKLEQMYWLEETKKASTWAVVREALVDGTLFTEKGDPTSANDSDARKNNRVKLRSVMFQVNPYVIGKDQRCTVVRHWLLKKEPKRNLWDMTRNWASYFGGSLPFTFAIVWLCAKFFPRGLPGMISFSLKSLWDVRYVNKGYKVLYQGAEFVKKRAYDCEYAFDFNSKDYITAIEEIFKVVIQLRMNYRRYQSAPIGFRFVKGSGAYLSADYGKDVCYIDLPFVRGTPGADEMLDIYQDILLKYDGRPHWGKIHNRMYGKPASLKSLYPAVLTWQKEFRAFNSAGTFSNNFSDRLQLGEL